MLACRAHLRAADPHDADAALLGALVTGQRPFVGQDPLFAFRLLADIGLRALSPALDDTGYPRSRS